MDSIQFIKTQKGKESLLIGIHRYNLHTNNKSGSACWRCVDEDCASSTTINLDKDKILRGPTVHSCSPDDSENKIKLIIDQCKVAVCQNLIPIEQIFDQHFEEFDSPKPLFSAYRSSLYRARKRYLECNKLTFKEVKDVFVPEVFSKNFLLIDDGDSDKILVFGTKYARKMIKRATSFLADGTFKSVPSPYYQLYTLHIDVNSDENTTNIKPVIYALLPSKNENTYVRLFSLLKEKLQFNIEYFKSDYEKAPMNAVQQIFPNSKVTGCYHHYNDAVWKHAKKMKLDETLDGRKVARLCSVLPLLPACYIPRAWASIMQLIPENCLINDFKKYMEKQWFPKISSTMLSVAYERHRTTNGVEGWHRRLNSRIPAKPNFFLFLNRLRKEAKCVDTKLRNLHFAKGKQNRKKADIQFDREYTRLLQNLQDGEMEPISFLKDVYKLRKRIN